MPLSAHHSPFEDGMFLVESHYLSSKNEMCYSTKTQKISPTKHTLKTLNETYINICKYGITTYASRDKLKIVWFHNPALTSYFDSFSQFCWYLKNWASSTISSDCSAIRVSKRISEAWLGGSISTLALLPIYRYHASGWGAERRQRATNREGSRENLVR